MVRASIREVVKGPTAQMLEEAKERRIKMQGSGGNRGYKVSRRANEMHDCNRSKEPLLQTQAAPTPRTVTTGLSTNKAGDADREYEYAWLSWTVFGATKHHDVSRPEEKPGAQGSILNLTRAHATDAITAVNVI